MKTSAILPLLILILVSCEHGKIHRNDAPAIIPAPRSLELGDELFYMAPEVLVYHDSTLANEAIWFRNWLNDKFGLALGSISEGQVGPRQIVLRLDDSLKESPEHYTLTINPDNVIVRGATNQGVFRGLMCLRQFFPKQMESGSLEGRMNLRAAEVEDWPEFEHRGLLFDCCRHFMDKDKVLQYIDVLAYYRMNVLHWHLTEDQGWRIQIDKYPQLTEIGAWREGEDGQPYGGYYSKDDIREIVAYATERHITVVPEIELPGHSSAAIASYPWLSCTQEQIEVETEWGVFKDIYCAGNDSTIQFLKDVIDEVVELFPSDYVHIGGDEAPKYRWEQCPKCQNRIQTMGLHDEHELQSWFIDEMGEYLRSKGKRLIGWDEIHEGGLPEQAIVQSWRSMEGGKEAAMLGHQAIMSPTSHCYFDYGLDATDMEEVYKFDPMPEGLSEEQQQLIIGGECNMWTERAPQDLVDSKVFPRLLAMSEVLWSYPDERDFPEFQRRVEQHYPILQALEIDFGFETVPVEIMTEVSTDHVKVDVEHKMPGLTVQCDQGDGYVDFDQTEIEVSGDTHLDFRVFNRGKQYGYPIEASIAFHEGVNTNYQLLHSYSHWYTGGGDEALRDGRLGSLDFRDGNWQATQETVLGATCDLGSEKSVSLVKTQFYQYNNAWIFLPNEVVVQFFDANEELIEEETITHDIPLEEKAQLIHTFELPVEGIKARYVKVQANSIGLNPSWHDSPGQPSWLFCDEIIIR